MKKYFYEDDRQKRKEAYLLAKGNPWLLWRLQVFRAGYVPRYYRDKSPRELIRIRFRSQDDYDAEALVKHANQVRSRERHYLAKMFTLLMISMALFIGLSMFVQYKMGNRFRIPLVESMFPRVEMNQRAIQS